MTVLSGRTRGTLLVLLCVALWGLIPVVARLGQASLDNHQLLFWSSLVSFLGLFAYASVTGQVIEMRSYRAVEWLQIFALGLLGTYIYYLFLYLGYVEAIGLEVLVVQYSWPVLIALFSVWILKEQFTWAKGIALLLGFAGVVTVLTRGQFDQVVVSNLNVIVLVGAGAACFALFSVLGKRVQRNPANVVSLYFLAALIASFVSMMVFSGFAVPSRAELLPVLLNGLLVNGFSYIFWIKALQATEASYLAPFTYLAPLLSAVYLVLIFNEPVLPAYLFGLVLVLAGGLVNALTAQR